MPPLPADSIHARACKLKCEKILTRPRSRKGLNFREQDTGQGFRFMEGNSRALVKACVNRPASCPLPPEAGCPGGAPFIAIHAGVVSEILCIQLSVGGGPSYLLGGF